MSDNGLQTYTPNGGALSVEHYQTFEMAKENDDILGGDNIAQLLVYTASARAKAQAIHAAMAATKNLDEAVTLRADSIATEQAYARVSIFGDQRIGEILQGLPKGHGNRFSTTVESQQTKAEALQDAGISTPTAYQLEQLAKNPDIVQAVIDKAEAEGRLVSRKQVLDAISEKKRAEQQRDEALDELEEAYHSAELMEAEVASLRRQVAEKPQATESEATRKRISDLEHERDIYFEDVQKLRKRNEDMRRELDHANTLIGEKQRDDSAQWDIEALTVATNNYLRQYGGKAWAFDQFYRVDEVTQSEFTKAISNLAAFAQNLAQMIKEQNNE